MKRIALTAATLGIVWAVGCTAAPQHRHFDAVNPYHDNRSESERRADIEGGTRLTSNEEFYLLGIQHFDPELNLRVHHCLRHGTTGELGVPLDLNKPIRTRDALILRVKFTDSLNQDHDFTAVVGPSSGIEPARVSLDTNYQALLVTSGWVLLDGTRPVCDTKRTWAGADGTRFLVHRDGNYDHVALVAKSGNTKVELKRHNPAGTGKVVTAGKSVSVPVLSGNIPTESPTTGALLDLVNEAIEYADLALQQCPEPQQQMSRRRR